MAAPRRPIELTETLQKVNVPSAIVDRHGIVTWENDAARETIGGLVGRPFTSVVAPEDVPLVEHQRERKLEGAGATDYEIEVLTPEGRRRVEISSVPVANGDECHAIFGIAVPRGRPVGSSAMDLTPRQREVLELLGEGASTEAIAGMLHLSRETVRNHVRHILRALGAHSRLEAVAIAHREGLLSTD